jgi:hypothetical protein
VDRQRTDFGGSLLELATRRLLFDPPALVLLLLLGAMLLLLGAMLLPGAWLLHSRLNDALRLPSALAILCVD